MRDNGEASPERSARHEALIAANLVEEDPEAIDGLVFPVLPHQKLSALLRDYDTQRTTGRKVRCAVCPTHTPHYRGFVGQLEDGRPFLIGINCGEQHFGSGAWADTTARLRRQQDEVYYRARVQPALSQIAVIYPLLMQWRDRIKSWETFRAKLKSKFPRFVTELERAALRSEGRLERDEERVVTVVDAQGNPRAKTVAEPKLYGRIPYPRGFLGAGADRELSRIVEWVKQANRILTDQRDLKNLEEGFRLLRKARNSLDDVNAYNRGWAANANPAWWEAACHWYNSGPSGGSFKMKGWVIIGGPTNFMPLPEFSPIDTHFAKITAAWPR